MQNPASIAKSFNELDFHDDTFVGITVSSAKSCDNPESIVEIQLLHYSTQKTQVLRFVGCTNIKVGIDFDVLADNLLPNTSRVDAHTDANRMKELIQSQKCDWDVGYGPTKTPLDKKLDLLNQLVCFRVQLFGGAIEIIAREFQIQ